MINVNRYSQTRHRGMEPHFFIFFLLGHGHPHTPILFSCSFWAAPPRPKFLTKTLLSISPLHILILARYYSRNLFPSRSFTTTTQTFHRFLIQSRFWKHSRLTEIFLFEPHPPLILPEIQIPLQNPSGSFWGLNCIECLEYWSVGKLFQVILNLVDLWNSLPHDVVVAAILDGCKGWTYLLEEKSTGGL